MEINKKNKKVIIIGAVVVAIIAVIAVVAMQRTIDPAPVPTPDQTPTLAPILLRADDAGVTEEGVASVIDANNQFALDFYAKLRNDKAGKNIFFSPYSIFTAVGMAYEGAQGKTAEEIQSVFHFPEDNTIRRSSIAAVINLLNREDAKYELHTANALWIQEDFQVFNEYIETIRDFYLGKVTNVDFVGATEETRKIINTWVESKTNNKIKDLIPKGALNHLTRLVITNAIYFKGDWAVQFDELKTRDEYFEVAQNKRVNVPMMRKTDGTSFYYAETEDVQILEMLYEGDNLSMMVILPKNRDLETLENNLSIEKLNQWRDNLRKQEVDIFIPRFTFDTGYTLNTYLKQMGIISAFIPFDADFSGISEVIDFHISKVIHKAFINVNEEGTEAAAATGIIFEITALPDEPKIPVFRADHPFIFLIQERETGMILFMGRVVNPIK